MKLENVLEINMFANCCHVNFASGAWYDFDLPSCQQDVCCDVGVWLS